MRSSSALLLATALAFVSGSPTGQDRPRTWALLVAGSYGYENYRHQADVCHAYQILHQHGVPDEQIVVMMYDDIVYHPLNPTKGKIFNHPDGPNVYEGIILDYTGSDVTSSNFLNVLQGNKDSMIGIGTGKVIASTEEDHVFVYYVDHGAPGLVNFPNDYLRSTDLVRTLEEMHAQKKFAGLVFYLEACYSGSMFQNLLPNNINVFATTASSWQQLSFACYFDSLRQNYLGDFYSVKWMENSDAGDLSEETLQKQYKIVKSQTRISSVQEFGDLEMGRVLTLADFMGHKKSQPQRLPERDCDAVDFSEVPVEILKRKIQSAADESSRAKLVAELDHLMKNRAFVDSKMAKIDGTLRFPKESRSTEHLDSFDHNCYHKIIDRFHEICFNLARNSYVLKHLTIFAEICRDPRPERIDEVLTTLDRVCDHPKMLEIV